MSQSLGGDLNQTVKFTQMAGALVTTPIRSLGTERTERASSSKKPSRTQRLNSALYESSNDAFCSDVDRELSSFQLFQGSEHGLRAPVFEKPKRLCAIFGRKSRDLQNPGRRLRHEQERRQETTK